MGLDYLVWILSLKVIRSREERGLGSSLVEEAAVVPNEICSFLNKEVSRHSPLSLNILLILAMVIVQTT
jgi:predicted nucleic acid-binding Zn ribbon protein